MLNYTSVQTLWRSKEFAQRTKHNCRINDTLNARNVVGWRN